MTRIDLLYLGACIIMASGKHTPGQAIVVAESILDGVSGDEEMSPVERERHERRQETIRALEASGFNTSAAARILGINRTTLQGRMKNWGISARQMELDAARANAANA